MTLEVNVKTSVCSSVLWIFVKCRAFALPDDRLVEVKKGDEVVAWFRR